MAERSRRRRPQPNARAPAAPIRLQIEQLARGGEGLGRISTQGRTQAVFVPMTAPGDVVQAELAQHGGALRGRLLSVITASADRVEPPCPFAADCGGCDWMHLSRQAQSRYRLQATESLLARLGTAVPVRLHAAEKAEGYRTRVRLGVQADGGRVVVGYRGARSRELVQISACMIAAPVLDAARGQLAAWLAGSRGKGEVSLSTGSGGLAALVLQWDGELAGSVFSGAEQRVACGQWAGVELRLQGARAPAVIGDPCSVMAGHDGLPLRAAPGGFMQAHQDVSRQLVERVADSVPLGAPTLELFCGAGNLTVALAARTDRLEAVEDEPRAVAASRLNLAARGLQARVVQADANQAPIGSWVRTVVLDPPRVGAMEACKRLATSRARRVVMVSCDQATLERDLSLLVAGGGERGWKLLSAEVFEMFPHTSHVETMVVLERGKGAT
jgi:23S rRNA (uracil1939-C5)-methyltransferase